MTAGLPVNHPGLPADGTDRMPKGDLDWTDYPATMPGIVDLLMGAQAKAFTRDLTQLDARMMSLEIHHPIGSFE